jgi:zinc transporter, ZIP family
MSDVWIAFGLTVFAGMATGIGSIIAFTAKRTNYRFLSDFPDFVQPICKIS